MLFLFLALDVQYSPKKALDYLAHQYQKAQESQTLVASPEHGLKVEYSEITTVPLLGEQIRAKEFGSGIKHFIIPQLTNKKIK